MIIVIKIVAILLALTIIGFLAKSILNTLVNRLESLHKGSDELNSLYKFNYPENVRVFKFSDYLAGNEFPYYNPNNNEIVLKGTSTLADFVDYLHEYTHSKQSRFVLGLYSAPLSWYTDNKLGKILAPTLLLPLLVLHQTYMFLVESVTFISTMDKCHKNNILSKDVIKFHLFGLATYFLNAMVNIVSLAAILTIIYY